ncbi:hypothetical protein [Pseudovibrio japonicus]|nr:hypothetical protein [Pseudovibrio japonicus]
MCYVLGMRRGRSKRLSWDYLHVAIDDVTCLTYTDVVTSEAPYFTAAFIARALCRFH